MWLEYNKQHSLIVSLTLLLTLVMWANTTWAQEVSVKQPITIESDQAQIDEKKAISVYSGNVVLSQDGIKIHADKITLVGDAGQLRKLIAVGSPVRFSRLGDKRHSAVEGEAKKIEYFSQRNKVILSDEAKLSQGGNQFSGNRIEYDIDNQTVAATVSKTGKQRVQVTIQPQNNQIKPNSSQ